MLQGSCKNGVAVSTMTLEEEDHLFFLNCVLSMTEPLDRYDHAQNKDCRSVQENQKWLTSMTSGGYMDHICEFVDRLTNVSALEDAGFAMKLRTDVDPDELELEIAREDEFADIYGQGILAVMSERIRRGLWFLGWPTKVVRCLKSDELAKATAEAFKCDHEVWKQWKRLPGKNAAEKQVDKRGVFETVPLQQLTAGYTLSKYKHTSHMARLANKRSLAAVNTKPVEDSNGKMATLLSP